MVFDREKLLSQEQNTKERFQIFWESIMAQTERHTKVEDKNVFVSEGSRLSRLADKLEGKSKSDQDVYWKAAKAARKLQRESTEAKKQYDTDFEAWEAKMREPDRESPPQPTPDAMFNVFQKQCEEARNRYMPDIEKGCSTMETIYTWFERLKKYCWGDKVEVDQSTSEITQEFKEQYESVVLTPKGEQAGAGAGAGFSDGSDDGSDDEEEPLNKW